ncbi:MAG: PBP1A family penicillin-binding protein [Campylobacterales bacterium]|nr:PBP1A family penicillin-binding protein [Campylobacterales bacterium]
MIIKFFITLIVLGFLAGSGFLLYFYNQIRFEVDRLLNYNPKLTTQLFDRNGQLVANLFDGEHRIFAKYDEIPPRIIESLLAIEDTAFFEHSGINTDAILRAIIKDIKHQKLVEGASTLTQQLIKNNVLTREKTFDRKLKEVLLALRLETLLTKEEILERYLNEVYFGHGYYGIKTASNGYFKKNLDELTLKEIAILVGLPRAPSFYDPTRKYEIALGRANKVIMRLKSLGWIDEKEFQLALKETPMVYDESLTQNKSPYFVDEVVKKLSDKIDDLKYGGYKIYLTNDLEIEEIAKNALLNGYNKLKNADDKSTKTLNGGTVIIEPSSGNVLCMIGGVDYSQSNFNRATQSKRQPGSSLKPFLYQIALDLGYNPISFVADISRTYTFGSGDEEKTWQPKNYEKNFEGMITLKDALTHSRNLATINLVNDIGLDKVSKYLKSFGFSEFPEDLSITLGSFGISILDFSKAYTIISNYGTMVEPKLIEKIVTKYNKEITFNTQSKQITSPEQAFLMIDILKNVIIEGTGKNAKVDNLEIAGKTGTTNNNVDTWFCGFTPTAQMIVWYGNDDNTPLPKASTGGRVAAPIAGEFFKNYLAIHPEIKRTFDIPKNVFSIKKNGEQQFYTEISKIPQDSTIQTDDNLIF